MIRFEGSYRDPRAISPSLVGFLHDISRLQTHFLGYYPSDARLSGDGCKPNPEEKKCLTLNFACYCHNFSFTFTLS
ncbi:hypothetical protein OPV22_025072 [Ensete ventricosum]|uniref:Uncharacterized protein n=1 Tax=Ensete ventricosum TaxID=4639 RepID=A0AAV8Q2U7_ENSVE|nr:hypothetical protein OPV22_025072 [Ensete ventricosum]